MAMWNAPLHVASHELAACTVAMTMQQQLMNLSEIWEAEGLPEIRFGLDLVFYILILGFSSILKV